MTGKVGIWKAHQNSKFWQNGGVDWHNR